MSRSLGACLCEAYCKEYIKWADAPGNQNSEASSEPKREAIGTTKGPHTIQLLKLPRLTERAHPLFWPTSSQEAPTALKSAS